MSDTSDLIAWCDIETTGTDEGLDPILEVAFVLTNRELEEVERALWIIRPPTIFEDIRRMDRVPFKMHVTNGLFADLFGVGAITDIAVADRQIEMWLGDFGSRIPLAGSGVSHFDRRFIRAQLPRTDKLLTYWAYDIGAVRRFLRLYGLIGDSTEAHEAKKHRALDDVRAHIAEAREYRTLLRSRFSLAETWAA